MEAFEESDLDACAEALEQQRKQFEFEAGLACFFFISFYDAVHGFSMVFHCRFIVFHGVFVGFTQVLARLVLGSVDVARFRSYERVCDGLLRANTKMPSKSSWGAWRGLLAEFGSST